MNYQELFFGKHQLQVFDICNNHTLNLFSDASTRHKNRQEKKNSSTVSSCYGAIAVTGNTCIEEIYRIQSITTVPAAELRGIRCSLGLAIKYRNYFKVINLFTDSQYVVQALRDNIYNWEYSAKMDYFIYSGMKETKRNSRIPNQELIFECAEFIKELKKTCQVNIIHISSHVNLNKQSQIDSAMLAFANINGFENICFSALQYLVKYNDIVDRQTRTIINRADLSHSYQDPIVIKPTPERYNQLLN